jgi:hypothetical protein
MTRPAPGRPKAGAIPAGDRSAYPTSEGPTCRRPAPGRPKAGAIPAGDRSAYPTNEGRP